MCEEIAEIIIELLCFVVIFPFLVLITDTPERPRAGTNPPPKSPKTPFPGQRK